MSSERFSVLVGDPRSPSFYPVFGGWKEFAGTAVSSVKLKRERDSYSLSFGCWQVPWGFASQMCRLKGKFSLLPVALLQERRKRRDKTIQVIKLLHSTGANTHNLINRLSISMHFFFFFFRFSYSVGWENAVYTLSSIVVFSGCAWGGIDRTDYKSKKKRRRFGARAPSHKFCGAHTKSPPFFFLNKNFCGENRQEGENDSLYPEKSPILLWYRGKTDEKGTQGPKPVHLPFFQIRRISSFE